MFQSRSHSYRDNNIRWSRCFLPFSPHEWLPHRLPLSRLIPQLLSFKHKQLAKEYNWFHSLSYSFSHFFNHSLFEPHRFHWLKVFLLVCLLGIGALLFSSSTQADAQWVMVSKNQLSKLQLRVSEDKVRVDFSEQPNQFGLFDGHTNTFYWVDEKAKEYQSWKQPLAFSKNNALYSSQATGRKTVAGIDCRQLEIQKQKIPIDQVCVAPPESIGLSKREANTFQRFVRSIAQLEQALTTTNTLDNIASLVTNPQLHLPSSPKPRWTINEPSQPNSVLRSSSNWGQDGGRRTLASDLPPDNTGSSSRLSPPRVPLNNNRMFKQQAEGIDPASLFPSDLGSAWLVAEGIPLRLRNLSSGEEWKIQLQDSEVNAEDLKIPSHFRAQSWDGKPFSRPINVENLSKSDMPSSNNSVNEDEKTPDILKPAWPEVQSSSGFRIPVGDEAKDPINIEGVNDSADSPPSMPLR